VSAREPRFKRRMSCRLRVAQRENSGIVLDVSRQGLFVQTSAAARVGDRVEIELSGPGRSAPITLVAAVRWQRIVPAQLRSVSQAGLGLQISHAEESYYAMLAEVLRGATPVKGSSPS
jgi:Tfp pilus assembly protein PilZ